MRTHLLVVTLLWGCPNPPADDGPADDDADTDTDTDADSDSDADTDTDPVDDDVDDDGFPAEVDCDDADATVYPGAPEICGDGRVTDCDRTSDDGLVTITGGPTLTDLGAALAAASAGDEIVVCSGTFVGPFTATVPVRLVAPGGPAATTLDGDDGGHTLSVPGGSEVVGFTIVGGRTPDWGGGLHQSSTGSFAVTDCVDRELPCLALRTPSSRSTQSRRGTGSGSPSSKRRTARSRSRTR